MVAVVTLMPLPHCRFQHMLHITAEYSSYIPDPCFAVWLYSTRADCGGHFDDTQANLYRQAFFPAACFVIWIGRSTSTQLWRAVQKFTPATLNPLLVV